MSKHLFQSQSTAYSSQTYSNFEFLIVDDGSTDNTINKIQEFNDPRILLIKNEQNKGNYTRRNQACKLASGKYIAVMDADDIAYPSRLEKQIERLEANDSLLCIGTFFNYINGPVISKPINYNYIKLALLYNNAFLHPSLVLRKTILDKIGYYNTNYYYSSDYDLVCKITKEGLIKNIPEVLMKYRYHKKQISTTHYTKQTEFANDIRINYLISLGFQLSDLEKYYFTLMMTDSQLSVNEINKIKLLGDKLKNRINISYLLRLLFLIGLLIIMYHHAK